MMNNLIILGNYSHQSVHSSLKL